MEKADGYIDVIAGTCCGLQEEACVLGKPDARPDAGYCELFS